MPLDPKVEHHFHRLLATVDDTGARGSRLMDDAQRLWHRIRRFISMNLVGPEIDRDALEVACFGLQLPLRYSKSPPAGRMGQVSLRERSEQAAESVITALGNLADSQLIDRSVRILRELPQRSPGSDEARVLADAVNLDDFGLIGLMLQAMQLSRTHEGVSQVAEGFEKRREYGYWEARLKDGFHFEPVRQIARERLQSANQVADLLLRELKEDRSA